MSSIRKMYDLRLSEDQLAVVYDALALIAANSPGMDSYPETMGIEICLADKIQAACEVVENIAIQYHISESEDYFENGQEVPYLIEATD